MAVVHTRYYTDPSCPWSWALEPSLRRLQAEFGESLQIEYVMAGMGSAFDDPSSFVLEALQANERSGMPVDVRLWLQDPPSSSNPACMAVKAADEQGRAGPYLRRLREGIFCRGHKLDSADGLLSEARTLPGLDLERFRIALASHGVLELLAADLEEARRTAPDERSEGQDRVKLPSLEFRDQDGRVHGVYGYSRYDTLREAAQAAGAGAESAAPSIEDALSRFGAMTTVEVAEVCRLPGPTAPAALWKMAAEWRVTPERCGAGELWSLGERS
ncbi:MAG TPA: DsbA family protein [Solirubrobacteraceae bacterium]|jgi:predicted DsbA family dithiol-disulfide isomerase